MFQMHYIILKPGCKEVMRAGPKALPSATQGNAFGHSGNAFRLPKIGKGKPGDKSPALAD